VRRVHRKHIKEFSRAFWFSPADAFLRSVEFGIWDNVEFAPPTLDIGCGDGSTSRLLFPNRKIDIGLDLEPKAVKEARKLELYGKTVAADASKMPFAKNSFRTVVSNSTFEHIEHDQRAICEISRVLKRGGVLHFTTTTNGLQRLLEKLTDDKKTFERFNDRVAHFHYRSLDEWRAILKKNGLEVVRYQYYFPKSAVKTWYRLFRIQTFRPYRRELWSYLRDSPYGRLVPSSVLSKALEAYLANASRSIFTQKGSWVYIKAVKK